MMMTLVAAYATSGAPVLLGDIIISRIGIEDEHVPTPVRNNVEAVLPKEWMRNISRLQRKVFIIAPNITLAWTGDALAASQVIGELKKHFSGRGIINSVNFFSYLSRNNFELRALSVTLIGWASTDNGITAFRWNSKSGFYIQRGSTFVDGEGKEYFVKMINARANQTHSDDNDIVDRAVFGALNTIGSLISDEATHGENLWDVFGGGYEIVVWANGRFRFVNDILFVFMVAEDADQNNGGEVFNIKLAPTFIIQRYICDELVIERRELKKEKNGLYSIRMRNIHIVGQERVMPEHKSRQISNIAVLNYDLNAGFICCTAFYQPTDSDAYLCTTASFPAGQEGYIRAHSTTSRQSLSIGGELIEKMTESFIRMKGELSKAAAEG